MAKDKSGWSSFAKATLVVLGAITVLVAICAIVATVWWKRHGKEFVEYAKTSYEEGQREGSRSDETGCLKTAADRLRSDASLEKMMRNLVQMRVCLSAAQPNESFCQDVPEAGNKIDSSKWMQSKCAGLGLKGQACGIVGVVQEYCYSEDRLKKISSAK